jgi:hypothetical protein
MQMKIKPGGGESRFDDIGKSTPAFSGPAETKQDHIITGKGRCKK